MDTEFTMRSGGQFLLRPAEPGDVRFLATALMEAMGGRVMERQEAGSLTAEDERRLGLLAGICGRDDTLYSWRLATVASAPGGERLGASIAYPGAEYHSRRLVSFALAREIITFDTERMEDEAGGGELYLDTLAVLPKHRRQGIGQTLMRHWLARAREEGLTATLACATDNGKARRLYESMGLCDAGLVFIFGEYYRKMALDTTYNNL